jgi:diguanylate cyclase
MPENCFWLPGTSGHSFFGDDRDEHAQFGLGSPDHALISGHGICARKHLARRARDLRADAESATLDYAKEDAAPMPIAWNPDGSPMLIRWRDSITETSSPTRAALKQRLRLRRFSLASIFSLLYLFVLLIFHSQGKVDRTTLFETCAIVVSMILAFYVAFKFRLNLRFPDPSLTAFQLLSAVLTMVFVVYRAPDTRLAFTAFFFVALMFGMLRCSATKLTVLSLVSLTVFALATWRRYSNSNDFEMLRLDMLQCLVIAITFPWVVYIGGRVKRLQRDLVDVSTKLEDIQERSRYDDLTGVYNRRALMIALERSKQRANVTGEPLSICIIDLDLFKRYNDEFDHLTGDRVLQEFAHAVQAGLRSTDIFGRYGGEEFVQILPHTGLAGAILDAERLRNRISTLDLPFARSTGPLTVSVGVAQYSPGETIDQTFARADGALYKAKQLGRNRVEC